MKLSKNPESAIPDPVPAAFVRLGAVLGPCILFALLAGAPARADFIQAYDDWTLQTNDESGKRVCLIWSQPKKEEGKYKKRGSIYTYVVHRPANDSFNEISFRAGYTFRKKSVVSISIDKNKFEMFTDGDTAWNSTPKEDAQMVKAMRAGNTMIVRGVSSRGTKTVDTYSLRGFTKAHKALGEACPKKKPAKKKPKKKNK